MKRPKHQEGSGGKPERTVVPEARQLRKQAGDWLKLRRADAGLSQVALAERLGMKYYTFISQVENGFSRVPTEAMEAWAMQLGLEPADFAKHLLLYYEPELYRLLFGKKK
jgi:transcriptional regulator with XRE-family HTH domain